MKDRLIDLMKTFSADELMKCQQLIESQFFNTDHYCKDVFAYLLSLHPEYEESKVSNEKLIGKFYSKAGNKEKYLSNTKTRLTRVLEEFLIWQNLESKPAQKDEHLLEALFLRRLEGHFDYVMNTSRKDLEKSGLSHEFYTHRLRQDILQYRRDLRDTDRQKITNVNPIIDSLDKGYVLSKLFWISAQRNMELLLNADNVIAYPEDIYNLIKDESFSGDKVFQIYYLLVKVQSDCDLESLGELLHQLNDISQEIPRYELTNIYTFCTSICIDEIVKKKLEFYQPLLRIYRSMEEKDVLFAYTPRPGRIKNLLSIALKMGEFDWAEQMLEKYKDSFPESVQENADKFYKGAFHFFKGEYAEALDKIQDVANDSFDLYFQIDARLVVLKAAYEIEDYNLFQAYHKKTEQYFKDKKKISKDLAQPYINFINQINLLFKLKLQNVPESKFNSLKNKIEKTDRISDYHWISTKLSELEDRIPTRRRKELRGY